MASVTLYFLSSEKLSTNSVLFEEIRERYVRNAISQQIVINLLGIDKSCAIPLGRVNMIDVQQIAVPPGNGYEEKRLMTSEIKPEPVEYVKLPELGLARTRNLMSLFVDSSSDEEDVARQPDCTSIKQQPAKSGPKTVNRPNGFTSQPAFKPEKQDVDIDALTNVFSEMVVSRHAILHANQWEPVRYEKGEALERIEKCVANMLVSAYNSTDTNITHLLESGPKFFKTKEEREDAHFVGDQLEQLMDRIVGWKISEKKPPRVDDIGNMVARNRPMYLPISRRIVRKAQIDEHSRISMNNTLRAYIEFLKQNHPHEVLLISRLEARERDRPLTEAEQKAKRKAYYEREAHKYMLNGGEVVDKSLVVFDYSLLENIDKKAEQVSECLQVEEAMQFEDVQVEKMCLRPSAVVQQPLRSALKKQYTQTQSTTSVVQSALKDNQMLQRRQQLRRELGAHLSQQHPSIYVEAPSVNLLPQERKRKLASKKQAPSRKSKRVACTTARRPPPRNNSVQQQKNKKQHNMASQTREDEEDDGFVEDESEEEEQQQEYQKQSSSKQKNYYEDKDEFGSLILPGPRLKSCFKRKDRFSLSGAVRRIKFNEYLETQEYEIAEGCTLMFKPKVENEREAPFVFKGRYTVEEETVRRSHKNLINLPHRDAAVPVMKRSYPGLNNSHSVMELKKEMFLCYKDLIQHIENNSHRRVTRWLITDLLLSRLDKRILKNVVVTRIEYPQMPNWLIEHALNQEPELFPKEISYIFVACGFDLEMQYSRDNSNKPFLFLTKLHEWLRHNVGGKQTVFSKNVYPYSEPEVEIQMKCSLYKQIPTIVAITIPEVGDYAGQFEQFNHRLRAHVEMLKEQGGPDCTDFDLLDWAELVNESTDPEDTETVEDRIRLLMEHMANEYGILFHPIANKPDEI